jgi:hypothetical protein
MSVLKRQMFKGGGFAHRGTGITTGLVPVQRFDDGGDVGRKTMKDFFEENREMLGQYYQEQEPQSRLAAASPALLALSSALLSGKSYQGGLGGGLDILGQGLEKATPYFDQMVKARRSEKNAQRKEQFNLDMQALEWARADKAAEDKKYEPITFGDTLLRLTPEGTYETISTKPSKLVEAYDNELGENVFVPESLIRADIAAVGQPVPPGEEPYAQRYRVKRTVDKDKLVEAYDTEKKTYTWVPEDTLMEMAKAGAADPNYTPRYIAKAPDTKLVTMYHEDLKKNVLLFESDVVDSISKGENKYSAKREGLDTVKEVHSKSLDANIFVTQGNLLADMQKDPAERDFSEAKENTVYKTFYDPTLDQNVLATDQDVTDRLNNTDLDPFGPKKADKSDTILTMWNKKEKHNMLVTEAEVLEDMKKSLEQRNFEPEHKQDPTKSAINTETDQLEFVTNKQIAESGGKYIPAIIGNTLTIGENGEVVMKSTLMGAGMDQDDVSQKTKDLNQALEDLTIFATSTLKDMENINNIDRAFGVSGWLIDFNNKYLTQLGTPFDENSAKIRNDILELSNRVMRLVTQDQRFTNEDRDFINRMMGQAAVDKLQSYDQVLIGVQQITTMLEDRAAEVSGTRGMKASHEMDVEEMIAAYNNYRKVNGIEWDGSDEFTIQSNLPKLNKRQLERRLEIYHPDEWAKIQSGVYN